MASTKLIAFPVESEKIEAVTSQVVISEEMEQRRRMIDNEGEKKRMFIANKVAQTYKFSNKSALKHVPWPTNAPIEKIPTSVLAKAAVTNTLHNASNTASSMWSAATAAVGAAVHAVSQFGLKTVDTASHTLDNASHTLSAKTHEVADKASAAGHTLSVKTHEVTGVVSAAATSASHTLSANTHYMADKASAAGHTLSEAASGVAHDAKVALSHVADDIVYSTSKAYALALQEGERRRRMMDVDEQYAILNARNASACIKGNTFEFNIFDLYVPDGTSLFNSYTFHLLSEKERVWRMLPQNSLVEKQNATKLALVAKRSFVKVSAPVPSSTPFTKPVVVDITPKKAYSPAL